MGLKFQMIMSASPTCKNLLAHFAATILTLLCACQSFATPARENALIRAHVLDASTGLTIPCTVAIRASNNSIVIENPDFAGGFRSSGQFEKAVPPGETTITISRGFDYVAVQQKLELSPGQRVQLTFRLHRQTGLRRLGWYGGDSHIHMIHGAGKILVDFPAVALAGRAAGLDYMSIAQDWNLPAAQITPAHLTSLCNSLSTPDFIFAWNMEAPKSYWRGDVTRCLGHCWELGMRGYTPKGQDAIQELFRMSAHDYESEKTPTPNFESQALIHALGGIVAYTHPCRWWWGDWGGEGIYPKEAGKFISNLAQELPYDTVVGPTYDTMDILMQSWDQEADQEAQRLWFLLLNKGYRIPGTASTDSTFNNPDSALPGIVRVYTRVEGTPSIAAIAQAMKAGRNFVTSGPLLLLKIGGHPVGDVIHVSQPSSFQVRIRAWPSGMVGERLTKVELIRNGESVKLFPVSGGRKEFKAEFTVHEAGSAWYIARCFGSNDLQVAISDPIYFEGRGYKPPQPTLAHVTGTVTDRATGKPLDGKLEVVRMVGLQPSQLSTQEFTGGRFTLDVPGTARLRIQAPGYAPLMKSVFMDYPPLLRMTLNMREAEITDWRTFEEIKYLLGSVRLNFQLRPLDGKKHAAR
ncbi:MAG: CehA/McbA family metallohydrolase [Terriglobia bacterium]